MLFLDTDSYFLRTYEEGAMYSALRNTSKPNTRLDKFLFLLISFCSVSGLVHVDRGT